MRYNIMFKPGHTILIDDQGEDVALLYGNRGQCEELLKQLNTGHRVLQKGPKQKCPSCKGLAHRTWYEGSIEEDRDGLIDFEVHVEHCAKCKGLGEV